MGTLFMPRSDRRKRFDLATSSPLMKLETELEYDHDDNSSDERLELIVANKNVSLQPEDVAL